MAGGGGVFNCSDAWYQEMPDNILSQKYRNTGIPRYMLVDVKVGFLFLSCVNK